MEIAGLEAERHALSVTEGRTVAAAAGHIDVHAVDCRLRVHGPRLADLLDRPVLRLRRLMAMRKSGVTYKVGQLRRNSASVWPEWFRWAMIRQAVNSPSSPPSSSRKK